jgi:hypothetical protein
VGNVAIPPRLEPADLDWKKSRPVVPWPVNIVDFGSFDHPSGRARFHIRVQQGWDVAAIPPEVLADDGGGVRWQVHSICLLKAYVTEHFGIQGPMNAEPATAARPAPERPAPLDPFRTGAAGRPTAIEYIEAEARRRIDQGEVTPIRGGLTKFAKIWRDGGAPSEWSSTRADQRLAGRRLQTKSALTGPAACEASKISSEFI